MNKNITRTLLSAALILSMGAAHAQENTSEDWKENPNLIKWNVGALLFKSASFQYERAVSKKISVGLGFRTMPKSGVPFKSLVKDIINDDETWNNIKGFKMGNFAITPEARFYLGESVFKGFYIAPFVRYAKYDFSIPFVYDDIPGFEQRADFNGKVNAFTGGVVIGAQFKLSKSIFLDWSIIGPNWGTSNGTLIANKSLTPQEQEVLRNELENFADDVPIIKLKPSVDGNGATIKVDGPWAGFRAGLGIGYKF